MRDQNYLSGQSSWLTGLSSCVDHTCTVDLPNFTNAACSGTCPALTMNATGLYTQGAGTPSIYTRVVDIHSIPGSPDEVNIQVTVSWQSGTIHRQFVISEHLFNWL